MKTQVAPAMSSDTGCSPWALSHSDQKLLPDNGYASRKVLWLPQPSSLRDACPYPREDHSSAHQPTPSCLRSLLVPSRRLHHSIRMDLAHPKSRGEAPHAPAAPWSNTPGDSPPTSTPNSPVRNKLPVFLIISQIPQAFFLSDLPEPVLGALPGLGTAKRSSDTLLSPGNLWSYNFPLS